MANVLTSSLIEKYLQALTEDERLIADSAERYEATKAALDVGLRRYIALRDFVTEQLGRSPYSTSDGWPVVHYTPDGDEVRFEGGRFRYTGKSVGDGILEVLRERKEVRPDAEGWMRLSEIIAELSAGGLGFPDPIQARAVNAALLKTSGVKRGKYQDGTAAYCIDEKEEGGELDPDDLPFE